MKVKHNQSLLAISQTPKQFYENHLNFAARTIMDYYISPGTMAKFNCILNYLKNRSFLHALEVGCSGNALLHFVSSVNRKFFVDLAHRPLTTYRGSKRNHPVAGSIVQLPFPSHSFDLVIALDVVEHIKNDQQAVMELTRVLKTNGILVVSVPHRMKFYSYQDMIIGHYRRYELAQLRTLFPQPLFQELRIFGIYGQMMRVQFFQAANPRQIESGLLSLRTRYLTNPVFHAIWKRVVKFGAFWMAIDARFQPFQNLMNICLILQKK